jgi:outer membrane protein assembly factor BamB
MGINWMTDTLGPVLSSPVVAYSAALGEALVYSTNEAGDVEAMNLATGQIVWSYQTGYPIVASPLVVDGSLWVASELNPEMIKLDADTGEVQCTVPLRGKLLASPTEGIGPNGSLTIYEGELDIGGQNGPLDAIDAATCAIDFQSRPEPLGPITSGPWDPISYGTDGTGRALVFMGTSDPDDGIYAIDASTGAEVWRVASPYVGDNDFAAGVTVSPPGANGYPDGVVYVPGKDGWLYAIDMTTGAEMWTFNFGAYLGTGRIVGRSTAALTGTTLVFGTSAGTIAMDVLTQQVLWSTPEPNGTEVISSPAIVGPNGSQVVVIGDLGGAVRILSLATGQQLFAMTLGGYITASPAESDGNIVIASSDGFVYDLAPGGGTTAGGTASISYPQPNQTLPNPNGSITISGTATDPVAVASVQVAVRLDGPDGLWWDGNSGSWVDGPFYNAAALTDPAEGSSGWSLALPVPEVGAAFNVDALEQSTAGPESPSAAITSFAVTQSTSVTYITPTPTVVYPGQEVSFTGGHFYSHERVDIALPGARPIRVEADPAGTITGTMTIPDTFSPYGQTLLTATGRRSGDVASYPIDITDSWTQTSQNAEHTGLQPNNIAFGAPTAGAKYTLGRAWAYADGSPMTSSPTVYDNVVYVGDTSGTVTALLLQSGAVLWTYAAATAITTSPVYDNGMVYAVAGSQILALDASTGSLVWSTSLDGTVQGALTVAGGVLYLGTTTDQIEAVSEADGSVIWQTTVPGAVTAAPSVDTGNGLLITGDEAGVVTALALSTGLQVWQVVTGSAISVSPTISANWVYVGSADGIVGGWNELTGDEMWTTQLPGAVTATAGLTEGVLVEGTSAGTLSALDPTTGAITVTMKPSGAKGITGGIALTTDRVEVTTANGNAYLLREPTDWAQHKQIYTVQTSAPLSAGPVMVNNELLIAGQDGLLYCYTPGQSAAQ